MFQKLNDFVPEKGPKLTNDRAKLPSLPIFEENPFLDGVGYNQKRRTEIIYDGRQAVIQSDTGEVLEDHLAVARVKHVDADQFVKVYLANLHLFFDLGKPAQRVAEFVLNQIGHRAVGRGEVLLTFGDYEKYFKGRQGGTRTTWQRGLAELAGKNLIAKSTTSNVWWINPAVAFNGDRARFITEIRRKKGGKPSAAALEKAGQGRLFYAPDGELVPEEQLHEHGGK